MVSSVRGRLLKSKEMTFKKRKGVSGVKCAERADICGLYISFISSLIPLMTTNWRLIFFFNSGPLPNFFYHFIIF